MFEAFIDGHIDVMGDSLLTLLFCLFCIAITGLLRCILTFGGHGRLVAEYETTEAEKSTTLATVKKS